MTRLLGLDIGTTGVRCVAIDERGDLVADASEEYPLYTPQPGWSEQRPEDWWEASRRVIASVAARAGRDVSGIGLAGQMHGAVFLDHKDAVIRPALLWNDQRTEAQCQAITERVGARRLTEITGNPALTGFQAPKILWLRDEEPKAYERVATVLLPKDYIRLKLTGEKATDASDASGTLLLDLMARTWSSEILQSLDIPAHWLPQVHESPETSQSPPAPATTRPPRWAMGSSETDWPAARSGPAVSCSRTQTQSRPTPPGESTPSATPSRIATT